MTVYLREDTASQEVALGPFVDETDGKTAETALTIANTDIKIWKSGAITLADKNSGGATHISGGIYYAVLDATDTSTIGPLRIFVHVAGALPVVVTCVVLDEAVYDTIFGTTALSTYAGGAVASVTGAVGSVTGNVGGNVAGSVASVTAGVTLANDAITAAKIATGAIDADAIAADAVTEIQSGLATAAELAKVPKSDGTASWNATALAAIQSEANDALVANHLDHLLAEEYDPASKPGNAAALLNELVESDGGVSRFTANALEQGPAGEAGSGDWTADEKTAIKTILGVPASGTTPEAPTAGALKTIDDVVDAILVDTAEIGAAGAGLTEAGGTGDQLTAVPWNAAWDAEVQSEATDALNAYDPPTKAELDSAVDALPTAAENAAAVWDEPTAGNTTAGTFGERVTRIPNAAAGGNGGLPTVDANNYVAGIQGTKNQLDDLNDLSAAAVQSEAEDALAAYDPPTNTEMEARTLDAASIAKLDAVLDGTVTGSVNDASATTTSFVTDLGSAVNDFYNGRIITFKSGALAGQQREITDYVGATKTVTVAALTSAPANGVLFAIT